MRAATSGVLDRALDVAAALEVRGYGPPGRPQRTPQAVLAPRPRLRGLGDRRWWRWRSAAASADLARFSAYPSLHAPVGAGAIAVAAALLACALLPFADRRGVQR